MSPLERQLVESLEDIVNACEGHVANTPKVIWRKAYAAIAEYNRQKAEETPKANY